MCVDTVLWGKWFWDKIKNIFGIQSVDGLTVLGLCVGQGLHLTWALIDLYHFYLVCFLWLWRWKRNFTIMCPSTWPSNSVGCGKGEVETADVGKTKRSEKDLWFLACQSNWVPKYWVGAQILNLLTDYCFLVAVYASYSIVPNLFNLILEVDVLIIIKFVHQMWGLWFAYHLLQNMCWLLIKWGSGTCDGFSVAESWGVKNMQEVNVFRRGDQCKIPYFC